MVDLTILGILLDAFFRARTLLYCPFRAFNLAALKSQHAFWQKNHFGTNFQV